MLHPAHGDEVVEALEETIPDAVLGISVNPRIVPDRHFRHGESVHERQRGKEAVHAGEQLKPFDHGPAKNLQGAAGVVHPVAGDGAADRVGDARGNLSREAVVAIGAPSADEIELFRVR